MPARPRLLAAAAAAFALACAPAPALALDHDVQSWSLFFAQGYVVPKLRWYAEVQPRFGNDVSELDRLLVRPALGYQLTPALSLWAGYAWTPLFSPEFRNEHRPFQQVLVENKLDPLFLINRTRFEQRIIEDADGVSLRLRHMVRGVVRFGDSPLGVAVYDEVFFTLTEPTGAPRRGFDQNRAFVGPNYKFSSVVQAEIGYMNNFINLPPGREDRMNHNIMFMLFASFPSPDAPAPAPPPPAPAPAAP
ncbi:MAG TPA: DUF2490 domain-containing protein [Polyangiaceae bacterium]|nr:DUF2490 domain-containing protein [Polyangiaceae bacterium]